MLFLDEYTTNPTATLQTGMGAAPLRCPRLQDLINNPQFARGDGGRWRRNFILPVPWREIPFQAEFVSEMEWFVPTWKRCIIEEQECNLTKQRPTYAQY